MSFFLNDMWTPGRPTRPWFSWKPSLKRFSALGFIVELRSPARMVRDPLAAVALPGTPEGRHPDQRGTCVIRYGMRRGRNSRATGKQPESKHLTHPRRAGKQTESNRKAKEQQRETAGKQPENNPIASAVHVDTTCSAIGKEWEENRQARGVQQQSSQFGLHSNQKATRKQKDNNRDGAGEPEASGQPRGNHPERNKTAALHEAESS